MVGQHLNCFLYYFVANWLTDQQKDLPNPTIQMVTLHFFLSSASQHIYSYSPSCAAIALVRVFPHSCRVANVWHADREETQWVMVVPMLKECAGSSWSACNCPLHGHALADCSKCHCKSTNLGTLYKSGEEERLASPTVLVGSAN